MHAWPPLRSRGRKQPACQGSSPVGAERLAFRATEAVGHFCNSGEKRTIGGLGALENPRASFLTCCTTDLEVDLYQPTKAGVGLPWSAIRKSHPIG